MWLPCDLALANCSGFEQTRNAVFEPEWKSGTVTGEFLYCEVTGSISAAPFLRVCFFPKIVRNEKKKTKNHACISSAFLFKKCLHLRKEVTAATILSGWTVSIHSCGLGMMFWPWQTTGFWEPGHQPATPGQLSPMKPVLEAHKPSQNAVIASTAQVDQVASECACGLKTNSQWKYLSPSLNLHLAPMVLFRIQQGVYSPKCWCCHRAQTHQFGVASQFVIPPLPLAAEQILIQRGVPGGCSCCFRSCDPLSHWPHPLLTAKRRFASCS